ncbi:MULTISPECIES: hypothetical protein [Lysinibacillus]|uniref:Uncharacterized protein n=3 Tax=Lysinibacillus TaxID=400634 RepID=A0A2S0K042_LYSSH|nr:MULTISPECIES: hypothetical protein [Lysinibacillus]AVK96669.1 hypothetical protein LS41612_10510 [Lysinibacillus sphaericus]MCS1383610.1 hypothetical protein [Lysinibacillus sphaericus]MED4545511.1 hypothetical protein [Lysinibacillus sphaericus]TKI50546.1 hypothetical protein FC748_04850 [Lysinibacillus tabacifolii]SUV17525.1 Uncharacterised protein [Lysinibacillus sphaericus]
MVRGNSEFLETGTNSRDQRELIKCIYNCKDKELIKFLGKHLKRKDWNGDSFYTIFKRLLKYETRNSNIKGYIKNIQALSTEDRLILKARLVEIECTYDRVSILNLSGVGLFAFLLIYKEMSKEILFKQLPVTYYYFMQAVYILVILFLIKKAVKSKHLQSQAKYFLTIIDNVKN